MTVGTEIVAELEVKTSAWVDVEVLHETHQVKFQSHGNIVLRFTQPEMFGLELLHLDPEETKVLDVREDCKSLYYIFQLAPVFTDPCGQVKTQTVMFSLRSNSNPSGPIITP